MKIRFAILSTGKVFLFRSYMKSEREVVVHGKLNTNANNDPDFKGDTRASFEEVSQLLLNLYFVTMARKMKQSIV